MYRTGCHGACRALVSARARGVGSLLGFDTFRRVSIWSLVHTQQEYLLHNENAELYKE